MHVLLISLVFKPDGVSTARLISDLASDLVAYGHQVTVLTTTPHYNRDPEAEATQPARPLLGGILAVSDYHGVRVYHTRIPRKGRSVLLRLMAWVWFHLVSTVAAILLGKQSQVIFAPSPPLTIGVSAWAVGLVRSIPFIYNVQEIYPDIAISLGALKNRTLIRMLYWLERFVYRRARAVTVIGPRMEQRLLEKGVPAGKLIVVPNFVDLSGFAPRPKDNAFSREFNLHDKFVVSYSGNLGPSQGLEFFVDVAARLRDRQDIRLLLIGDGMLAVPLKQQAAALGLVNLLVLPFQPFSRVPDVYGASDLCLVPQALATGSEAVPSKAYGIMACERPIVAATDADSDLARLVRAANAGVVISAESATELADLVRTAPLEREQWRARAVSGRAHVMEHYARSKVTRRYEELLLRVARRMEPAFD